MSHWLPVQQSLDINEQRNPCKIPLSRGKSRKQASTYLEVFRRAYEYFSYKLKQQKRERICVSFKIHILKCFGVLTLKCKWNTKATNLFVPFIIVLKMCSGFHSASQGFLHSYSCLIFNFITHSVTGAGFFKKESPGSILHEIMEKVKVK